MSVYEDEDKDEHRWTPSSGWLEAEIEWLKNRTNNEIMARLQQVQMPRYRREYREINTDLCFAELARRVDD